MFTKLEKNENFISTNNECLHLFFTDIEINCVITEVDYILKIETKNISNESNTINIRVI